MSFSSKVHRTFPPLCPVCMGEDLSCPPILCPALLSAPRCLFSSFSCVWCVLYLCPLWQHDLSLCHVRSDGPHPLPRAHPLDHLDALLHSTRALPVLSVLHLHHLHHTQTHKRHEQSITQAAALTPLLAPWLRPQDSFSHLVRLSAPVCHVRPSCICVCACLPRLLPWASWSLW